MSESKDDSGIHRLFENKPRINPKTSPFVPQSTRGAFQTLERESDWLKKFFTETFYFQPGRSRKDFALVENIREGLSKGVHQEDCFVGHIQEPSEGVHDELLISTRKPLCFSTVKNRK